MTMIDKNDPTERKRALARMGSLERDIRVALINHDGAKTGAAADGIFRMTQELSQLAKNFPPP